MNETPTDALVRRHLAAGWSMLLLFLTLGILLEAFHGFKVGWYLDTHHATRRLMWRLAHAHGVLLGLVNLGFALTAQLRPGNAPRRALASGLLLGGSVLLPGGFFLGGLVIYQGDPGLGIYLTPVGAAMLFVAVALTLLQILRSDRS